VTSNVQVFIHTQSHYTTLESVGLVWQVALAIVVRSRQPIEF